MLNALESLIQFTSLAVGIIYTASIIINASYNNDVGTGNFLIFGFSWAVFIYLTFLM